MENKRKKRIAPPRYDEAFKAGAIRMVTEQGRPGTEVAKELGICIDTLRSWLKAAGVQAGQADRQNRDSRRNPLHAQRPTKPPRTPAIAIPSRPIC